MRKIRRELSGRLRVYTVMQFCLLIGGCASVAPVMSIEEARKISVNFKTANYVAPPRTIDDLRAKFRNGRAVPNNCEKEWAREKDEAIERIKKLENASHNRVLRIFSSDVMALTERMISIGQFDQAEKVIVRALNRLPEKGTTVTRAVLLSQLARLHARLGDLGAAERQMGASMSDWHRLVSAEGSLLESVRGQLYSNAGLAAVAWLRGELPLAEYHFRQTLKNVIPLNPPYLHINGDEIRAQLALVIMQQGRLMEAEVAARNAIDHLAESKIQNEKYSGEVAAPVVAMAAILLEHGNIDDAEYLARIAVNMHESSCSQPQSLGLSEARRVWIDALAEQGNWIAILKHIKRVRSALANFPELFERQFGTSFAYIEAELNAGNAVLGRSVSTRLLNTVTNEYGPASYRAAVIEGILALADSKLEKNRSALARFANVMPVLIGKEPTDGAAINGRRERILKGYMDLLVKLERENKNKTAGLNAPGELLRLSSTLRLGRVQRAISAGAIRAAAGNPELSEIIRQEQDLNEEARALTKVLSSIRSQPKAAPNKLNLDKIKKRLGTIELARRTLLKEILQRFPKYAEFVNPKPMTMPQISKLLKPGQAILAFHVADKATYVWALPFGGKLDFAEIRISRNNLRKKIAELRRAVDPGPIQKLEDIPAYDVGLAHELYTTLLKPVFAGWKDATELLVVADGPLGALPISMLATSPEIPASDSQTLFDRYRNVQWLVKKVAVTSLPSVNSLISSDGVGKQDRTKRRPFIGFGDPFFSVQQQANAKRIQIVQRDISMRMAPRTRRVASADLRLLPRLPSTREEVIVIAKAVGADMKRDLYLGRSADERTVKSIDLSSYDMIAFATHGLVPGDLNGLNEPALALSSPEVTKDKINDGLLTMNEILGLKLNADWVLLSACNTAAADAAGAEAVSGLGRAFFYAGARTLLVSNWPVETTSTKVLMTKLFKQRIAKGKSMPSQMLRHAMLQLINFAGFRRGNEIAHRGLSVDKNKAIGFAKKDGRLIFSYAHPIFWAPFSLVGVSRGDRNK